MEGLDLISFRRATLFRSALFLLMVFAFLYWRYPFDGMMISDSWYLYANEGGPFKWYTKAQSVYREAVDNPLELAVFTPSWSLLYSNRGLIPLAVWVIDSVSIGDRQLSINLLCILVQILNAALFVIVIMKLGDARWLLPIFFCAILYPFAAGSHFWQFLIINNLAATLFLASLAAFLAIDHAAVRVTPRFVAWGAVSLICLWISLLLVNYANFMGPLYLYLGLYYSNRGRALLRFRRLLTPSSWLGAGFVLTNVVAVILFTRDVPSFLAYTPRYQELAARTELPSKVIAFTAVLGNAMLTFLSIVFSNSVGLLLYPLWTSVKHYGLLTESPWALVSILIIAVSGVGLLSGGATSRAEAETAAGNTAKFLLLVGVFWAMLGYLPFATAFGYPRVVGLTADRVNIAASWGVSICLGVLLRRVVTGPVMTGSRMVAGYVGLSLVAAVLLGNLYVQREYYVEGYRKERAMARVILEHRDDLGADPRIPIVLLHRKEGFQYPRGQLLKALQDRGTLAQGRELLRFVAKRYFLQENATSSFHLDGIMMFGCCPQTAAMTFDGYARVLKVGTVPVYKEEPPFHIEEDAEVYRIGYKDVQVWSASFGSARLSSHPKRQYRLVRLEIDESFFRLRGGLRYRVVPDPALSG